MNAANAGRAAPSRPTGKPSARLAGTPVTQDIIAHSRLHFTRWLGIPYGPSPPTILLVVAATSTQSVAAMPAWPLFVLQLSALMPVHAASPA